MGNIEKGGKKEKTQVKGHSLSPTGSFLHQEDEKFNLISEKMRNLSSWKI